MLHRPIDPRPGAHDADPGVTVVRGIASGHRLRHTPRRVVVTARRVIVIDGDRPVADFPRRVADATLDPPDGLIVSVAGEHFALHLPADEHAHAEDLVTALQHEPFAAALGPVDLPHRTRRALTLDGPEQYSLLLTRRRLLLLGRRHVRTEIALDCPRTLTRVRGHETVWPGGDLVFDRIVLVADGIAVELDVDHQLHESACTFVAALGGASDPPGTTCATREAEP